jgi:hypothetical protein
MSDDKINFAENDEQSDFLNAENVYKQSGDSLYDFPLEHKIPDSYEINTGLEKSDYDIFRDEGPTIPPESNIDIGSDDDYE